MKKKISMNGLIKIVPLAILCIVTGMINPVFFAGSNLIDLARSVSFLLIVSVGVTYVLLGASLDMSIGSVMGLGGAICGLCLVNSLPVWFSILMGLLATAVISQPSPALGCAELNLAAMMIPTKPASRETSTCAEKRTLFTLIPDTLEASLFPPTAMRLLPYDVFLITK